MTWQIDPEAYIGIDVDGGRITATGMDALWSDADRFVNNLGWLRRELGAAWVQSSLAPRGLDGVAQAVHTTNWAGDPWARGAWLFVPVGGSYADVRQLAEPVGGVLLFAGEVTSRSYPGTGHGAMRSGRREARRILGG